MNRIRQILAWLVVMVITAGTAIALTPVTSDGPEIIPADAACVEVLGLHSYAWTCTKPFEDPTTTTSSTTTTTTTTTTTLPPTTTTTLPPFIPDQCVLDQIAREPINGRGQPKDAFDIILTQNDANQPGVSLWTAPYKVDLGTGYGWISGDRKGYEGAYMFLVNLDTGKVVARVLFHEIASGESAYFKVNDREMDEIQQTHLGYDGTCTQDPNDGTDPQSQAQTPTPSQEYLADNSPEVRPLIPIFVDGVVVEDRSYTNTVSPPTTFFRFADGGLITTPFTDFNGVSGTPHTIYERQIVFARVNVGGNFFTAGVVYYDILDPSASFLG